MSKMNKREDSKGSSSSSSSLSSTDALKGATTGPFHILMGMSTPTFVADPRMKRDYVSKRAKAFGYTNATAPTTTTTMTSPWDGVTRVERELIECCEKITSEEKNNNNPANSGDDDDHDYEHYPGALQIDKEVQFVGILARDCHSMASRCLALAILEKTLEAYRSEMPSDDEDVEEDSTNSNDYEEVDENAEVVKKTTTNDREERARKRQRRMNNNNKGRDYNRQKKEDEKESFEEEEVTRLEQFLAAGGLKLLNRWLVEACDVDPLVNNTTTLKPPPPGSGGGDNPASSTRSSNSNLKQSPQQLRAKIATTRPLIIPILRFLEKIPFDKKVVLESKINKQIRKLGKLVDGILEARARGKHRQDDLENWSTEPGLSAETDALDKVKEAVEAVKTSWEEKSKSKRQRKQTAFSAPSFETIKKTMKERLDLLLKYEAGVGERPDWLEEPEQPRNNNSKSSKETTATKKLAADAEAAAAAAKKTKTQDLAAKERKAEREGLRNRLHAAENEHKERLAKLREQLRKLKHEHAPSLVKPSNNNGKKVLWKDGMRSQSNRNRNLLEEVRVFIKNTPAAAGSSSSSSGSGISGTDASTAGMEEMEEEEELREVVGEGTGSAFDSSVAVPAKEDNGEEEDDDEDDLWL